MSQKRQTRNSKKFKKAAASKRARAPMQKGGRAGYRVAPQKSAEEKAKETIRVGRPADPNAKPPKKPTLPPSKAKYFKNPAPIEGGRMYAGGTPNFDERTGTVKQSAAETRRLQEETKARQAATAGQQRTATTQEETRRLQEETRRLQEQTKARQAAARQQGTGAATRQTPQNATVALQEETRRRQEETAARQQAAATSGFEQQAQAAQAATATTQAETQAMEAGIRAQQTATRQEQQQAPNPADYRQGANDPAYRADMEEFARSVTGRTTTNYTYPNTDTNGDGIPDTYVPPVGGGYTGTGTGSGIPAGAPINLEIVRPPLPELEQIEPEDV